MYFSHEFCNHVGRNGAPRLNGKKHINLLNINFLSAHPNFGNGPNTVSESTVSNTELSEFFGPHRVPGRELSEFLSAYSLCAKANSPSFFTELTEFAVKLSEAQ